MEILSVKEVDKGAFKQVVDVKLNEWNGFIIRRIKIFGTGKDRWIGFPSECYEKDGKKQYFAYCIFEKPEQKKKFEEEFFSALDKSQSGKNCCGKTRDEEFEEIPF